MRNTIKNALEEYRADVSRCVRCGSCNAVCPSYRILRNESYSPRGRMALVKAALDHGIRISPAYRERLATCTDCLACQASCPAGVPVPRIIQAAKEQAIAEAGAGIITRLLAQAIRHPAAFRAASRLAPLVLHYGRAARPGSSGRRIQPKKPAAGKVAFFPGCAIDNFQPEIGRDVARVLAALGYEVVVPRGLQCCGKPLLSLGDRAAARDLAGRNANILRKLKADAIVTACASCGMMFRHAYPDLLGTETPAVQDIHEFLAPRIAGLGLRENRKCVTWHEPCHLGRGQGLSATAAAVLRSIPGLDLRGMKGADRCCGFGGVMRISHHALSDRVADEKARDIRQTGATAVITGCPGCRMQIAHALRDDVPAVEVLHTVQLIAEALPE